LSQAVLVLAGPYTTTGEKLQSRWVLMLEAVREAAFGFWLNKAIDAEADGVDRQMKSDRQNPKQRAK
jgi:hypothetical protein